MDPIKRAIRRFSVWLAEATDSWEPVERVLGEDLEQELLAHPGEWVAMTRDRLLATGPTAVAVLEAARAAGEPDPILYKVPRPGTHYFLAAQSG